MFRFAHGASGINREYFEKHGFECFLLPRVPAAQCRQQTPRLPIRWPRSTPSRENVSTPGDWAWSSRSLPTSVGTNACTASLCARNVKWMYNGRVRDSRWFTISARSMSSGRCPRPSSPPSACPSLFSLNIRALSPANPLQTGFFDSLVRRMKSFKYDGEI